jgi:nucleoside-triphosphatase THEP1
VGERTVRIILLSAERGAGKTTACLRLVDLARGAGLAAGGIVAPARYDADGTKVGIDVVDVFGGARRALAEIEPDPTRATVGQYRLHPEAEAWALGVLLATLDRRLDLAILDEIGPLELLQGRGYAPVLERLPAARCRSAVILVRASLAETLADRLRALSLVTVCLTPANRDQVPATLLGKIAGTHEEERG